MEHSKAITKKLKDEIFIWDPTAYGNKGYWYVLGTTGAFGRPASKTEAKKLGTPKKEETQPVSPKVIEESPAAEESNSSRRGDYNQATRDRRASILQMIYQKRIEEGEGLGSSIKGAISDKIQAKSMGYKETFDPINITKKLLGKDLAAIYGRKLGRSEDDIYHFTGYRNRARALDSKNVNIGKVEAESIEQALHTKVTSGNRTRVRTKEAVADVLAKLYNLIKGHHDLEIKENELHRVEQKKNEEVKNLWNKELIEALTGKKSETPSLKIKDFNVFSKDLYKKLEEMAKAISGEGLGGFAGGFLGGAAAPGATRMVLQAGKFVAETAATNPFILLGATGVMAVALQKEMKDKIDKNPFDPEFDNIPYALVARGVAKTEDEAASILHKRSLKNYNYNTVEQIYKIDDGKTAEEEIGIPKEKIKEYLDEPKNKKTYLQGIPKEERIKAMNAPPELDPGAYKSTQKDSTPVKSSSETASSVSKDTSIVETKKDTGKETVTPVTKSPTDTKSTKVATKEETNKIEETKPISPIIKSEVSASEVDSVPQSNFVQTLIGENRDLMFDEMDGYGSTVVADNSQQYNVVNYNTDGLLVEELTGVRLEETSLQKVMRQNLRFV